jgi:hypothetical protein
MAGLRNYKDILSELKINPVTNKIKNYRNKWIQHVRRMDKDRLPATLNYEISTMWENKSWTTASEDV